MGCRHHAARRFAQCRPGYLDALERNRGCASAYLRSRALTLAMAASISPARLAWASTGNPDCRISPLLGRFGPVRGLVALRQTFVRRCQNCVAWGASHRTAGAAAPSKGLPRALDRLDVVHAAAIPMRAKPAATRCREMVEQVGHRVVRRH
jgi:hypothetical protein